MTDLNKFNEQHIRLECLKLAAAQSKDLSPDFLLEVSSLFHDYVVNGEGVMTCPPDCEPEYAERSECSFWEGPEACVPGMCCPDKEQDDLDLVDPDWVIQPVRTVTMEQIENTIAEERYLNLGQVLGATSVPGCGLAQTTLCVLILNNGYTLIGHSACADPAKYDQQLGQQIAYNDAVRQVWPLLGYELKSILEFERRLEEVREVRD